MASKYSQIIKELGQVKENEPLDQHTTFKIGGPADLFYEAKTTEKLIEAVKLAQKLKTPFFILGGGSNILVSDQGFRGLVIKAQNGEIKIEGNKIIAEAGASLSELVRVATEVSLSGLEFAVGIPGTVGGAVRGNAGAWQQDVGKRVLRVQVLAEAGEVKWLNQEECQFSYRQSRFKESQEIILAVELELEKGQREVIKDRLDSNQAKRRAQPQEPSAGCIFINPKPKSAGDLIDQCGLKGKKIGQAQISFKHANFIVNLGGAKAEDVLQLIKLAKKKVKEKFDISLKEEIFLLGFDKM